MSTIGANVYHWQDSFLQGSPLLDASTQQALPHLEPGTLTGITHPPARHTLHSILFLASSLSLESQLKCHFFRDALQKSHI